MMKKIKNNTWKDEAGNKIWKDDFNNYIIFFANGGQEVAKTFEKAESIVKNMRY
jgi:hypothetical protein